MALVTSGSKVKVALQCKEVILVITLAYICIYNCDNVSN